MNGTVLHTLDHNTAVFAIKFLNHAYEYLITCGQYGKIKVWDMHDYSLHRVFQASASSIYTLEVYQSTRHSYCIAAGGRDSVIHVWDFASGDKLHTYSGHTEAVFSLLTLQMSGATAIVSGSGDNTIRVWNSSSNACEMVLHGHTDCVTCLASAECSALLLLISGSRDMNILVWDAITGSLIKTLKGHTGTITSLCTVTSHPTEHVEIDTYTNNDNSKKRRVENSDKKSRVCVISGSYDTRARTWDIDQVVRDFRWERRRAFVLLMKVFSSITTITSKPPISPHRPPARSCQCCDSDEPDNNEMSSEEDDLDDYLYDIYLDDESDDDGKVPVRWRCRKYTPSGETGGNFAQRSSPSLGSGVSEHKTKKSKTRPRGKWKHLYSSRCHSCPCHTTMNSQEKPISFDYDKTNCNAVGKHDGREIPKSETHKGVLRATAASLSVFRVMISAG
eukprot:CAMPEP_0185031738 /NCGR_PEP_ID=MMETSP1103-20130426/19360_1 /TAXON_ID=36769 /ORGANISM="Paraphysomonas bandaiensis, Strain Caron Lab Isolate" /LENGTH=447 /DNA_ID=CAMNT_0027567361 /DNA_START=263 /DNA_END=1607 /DNA_ORIENTATION=-